MAFPFSSPPANVLLGLTARLLSGQVRAIIGDPDNAFRKSVTMDATLAYTWSRSAETTDHAIEEGAPLTDNVRVLPFTVTLSCQIDDNSINFVPGFFFFKEGSASKRFNQLLDWQDQKKLLYFFHEDYYENIIISDITETKANDKGFVKSFDMTLKQLIIAEPSLDLGNDKGFTSKVSSSGSQLNAAV